MRTLLFFVALSGTAAASDFVDTRLVFVAGDDDFGTDAGTSVPASQTFDLQRRAGYTQFYDAREESETLHVGRTHLVLHKDVAGYFDKVHTEGALVIQIDHQRVLTGDSRALHDDGTYLKIEHRGDAGTFGVTLMPFDSDRLRLGGLWDVSWGGSRSFPGGEATPAMKLEWDAEWWDLFTTLKTARLVLNTADADRNGQLEAFYAIFAGVGGGKRDDGVRLDVQTGYIQKGGNPRDAVLGEPVDAGGVTGRIAYADGLPFEPSNDTRFYSADPLKPWNASRARQGWRIGAEVTYLVQTLEDPDRPGGVQEDTGVAAAAYGRGEYSGHRVRANFIYRNVSFLMFDAPGPLVPYQVLPAGVDASPEMVATFGYEKHLEGLHLTPGITLGAQQPAAVSSAVPPATLYPTGAQLGRKTILLRRADMFDDTGLHIPVILPENEEALPILGARFHMQLDLAEGFALLGQVTVLHDPNRIRFDQDVLRVNDLRKFDNSTSLGAAILAVAEF